MKFIQLNPNEFDAFAQKNLSHYTQSKSHFLNRKKVQGDCHIVGVKNNKNEVIAACLLTEARSMKVFKYFYTHRGPIMNYTDVELVTFFFKHLTKYLKQNNCLFVLVDPYIIENIRNHDGEILKSYNNQQLYKTLNKLGYAHQGFSVGYSNKSQIRWLSVLNLENKNIDDILNNMDYKTRRNIKKTEEMGVKVRTLKEEEIPLFYKLFQMAEEKHGFSFRDESYFKNIKNFYPENSFFKLAYIDLQTYQEKLLSQKEQALLEHRILTDKIKENPNSKKSKTKINQIEKQIENIETNIDNSNQLIQQHGNILNLAAALYIYNQHEVYYLASGSNPELNKFMGAYKLQWEMIKFAKNNKINRYNFYGITGDFSDKSEDAGVIKFKKGFNGHVEELVGDFIKPIRPIFFNIYKKLN